MEANNSQNDRKLGLQQQRRPNSSIVSPLPTKYQKLAEKAPNRALREQKPPNEVVGCSTQLVHANIGSGLAATAQSQQLAGKQETPQCP